jgi:tetratricopeptide (TPR) repeat protein
MSGRAHDPMADLLNEAVRHLNGGNWPLARSRLQQILRIDSSHAVAAYLQGVGAFREGRWAEAESLFRKALNADSAPPQVSLYLASALQAQGRSSEAITYLEQTLRKTPDHSELRLGLSQAHEAAGSFDQAIDSYRALLDLHPEHAQTRLRLAALLTRMVRSAEAEQLLRGAQLDRLGPADRAAWCHRMGLALKHQRRHPEALHFLEIAHRAAPQDRQMALDLAVLLQHLRRYDDAITVFEQLIDREPLDLEAHLQLNELLYRQGRDEAFLLSYDRAGTRTPQAASLLTAKGRFLLKTGRASEALAAFERALALRPADAGAMAGRARALEAQGEIGGAVAAHEASTLTHPDNPDSHIDAGSFLLRQQQPGRAKALLLKALGVRPTDQAALSLLCLCHRALGETREESWLAGYEELIASYDLPPPQGYRTMLDFNRDLAAYLEPLHDDKREHFTQTLRGGTRLYDEVFNNGHVLVERLRARIDEAVARYIAQLRADARHPFLARRSERFFYVSSWSSRLMDRGFHLSHVHPQGWISSAYYASVPQVCRDNQRRAGWLKFGEPTEDFGTRFPPRRYVQPAPGRLVLFPSYMWHGTVPFESPQTRITIAFDVAPLGAALAASR